MGLECSSNTSKTLYADLDNVPLGERMDRVSVARKLLRGLPADDVVERFWDREKQRPYVRVVRRTILKVGFDPDGAGGWSASTYLWCDGPGIPTPIWA